MWEDPRREGAPEWTVEQLFDIFHVLAVDQEENDVILRLDHRVVMGDDHFVATHDGTNGGAGWQLDLRQWPAHHPRIGRIAVRYRLNGFCRAAPQAVDLDHIATAHPGQQGTDGGLLRADRDVDIAAPPSIAPSDGTEQVQMRNPKTVEMVLIFAEIVNNIRQGRRRPGFPFEEFVDQAVDQILDRHILAGGDFF